MSVTDLLPGNAASNPAISGANFVRDRLNPVTAVTNGRKYLDTLANKYLVKPKSAHGINGFVFDCEMETTVTLQAEITEHYTENNNFIMDHVAHKPMRLVLRGLIGELVESPPQGVTGALSLLQGKLSTIDAMLGKYTPGSLKKIQGLVTKATDTVNKIDNYISRAQNLVGLFLGSTPGPTKQQQAFLNLYGMWSSNQVFTVETPFRYFDSMAIEQITCTQEEDSKYVSDITVTLKEIRFANVDSQGGLSQTTALQNCDGARALQAQGQCITSPTVGKPVDIKTLSSAPGLALPVAP